MTDVLFVVLPGTLLLDLAGPAEAFRIAAQRVAARARARAPAAPAYRLRFVGPEPDARTSVGAVLAALEPLPESLDPGSLVVLLGQPTGAESPLQPRPPRAWTTTRRWLARTVAPALDDGRAALATVCAGTLLAADAGLLAGRRCTTHHESLDDLRRLAPAATVLDNRVFVVDGRVASSAGVTAGIDLALHLIARDHGDAVAASVAQAMVVYLRRGPADPELSPMLAGRRHLHPALHRVQDAVCADPAADWTLAEMAAVACVTPRHLARLFREHVGATPHRWLEDIRVARVEQALAAGRPVKQAVAEAGVGGTRQWRRLRAARQGRRVDDIGAGARPA